MPGPLNYTTVVEAGKTAGECVQLLASHGATAIGMRYDGKGNPTGLDFQIATEWGLRAFSLPTSTDGTLKALQAAYRAGKIQRRYTDPEQARRVAWRVLRDWLEVQLALVEAGLAGMDQALMAYMHVGPGITMYERYQASSALEAGGSQ